MDIHQEFHHDQVALTKLFSSVMLLGPTFDDKLLRLVAHLFSADEAGIARYLPFYYPRSLKAIAGRAKKSPDTISPLLKAMDDRKVILRIGGKYALIPLIPGMFEYMLMSGVDSPWHRKYSELLQDVYASGYVKKYSRVNIPAVRNIPVQTAVEGKSHIISADLISEMIDYHKDFAVANVCQCRQSMRFIGKECKRSSPEDGCLIFGSFAPALVKSGNSHLVSKEEMRDIVAERWEKKLVFLTSNVSPRSPNAICTCCDCCCHFLEAVNHYDSKSLIAKPHYLAAVNELLCNDCGLCARVCNTYAHSMENKKHRYDINKCIGCGMCVDVCKKKSISLTENRSFKPPASGFVSLAMRLLPSTMMSGVRAKLWKD